jgi:hypothetical protein
VAKEGGKDKGTSFMLEEKEEVEEEEGGWSGEGDIVPKTTVFKRAGIANRAKETAISTSALTKHPMAAQTSAKVSLILLALLAKPKLGKFVKAVEVEVKDA